VAARSRSRTVERRMSIILTAVACGVDAACNCGAPVIPAWQRSQEFEAANPEKSDRMIAAEIGVDHKTVGAARRKSTGERSPVDEDDRPTIDRPPSSGRVRNQLRISPQLTIGPRSTGLRVVSCGAIKMIGGRGRTTRLKSE
jgi:hypothetical protein